MRYEKDVLDKALEDLFPPALKINIAEKLGIRMGIESDMGWFIPFVQKQAWLIVLEEDLELDIPVYYLGGGTHGLVLSEALFYVKESINRPEVLLDRIKEGAHRVEGDIEKLKRKQTFKEKAENGYFYLPVVVRFDFKEVLEDREEDASLLYPDHLLTKPEPKLGLRYATISLGFSI